MDWTKKLLHWYRKNKRDLPWRRTSDPYAIWVSEIMLQQTTVEAVIPYYERFLKRFPTVEALAKGPEEDVLKLWSGLGYYSRARNLHKAARQLTGEIPPTPFFKGGVKPPLHPPLKKGGRGDFFPNTVESLMALPGIGRYTAGAVASIAFGRRAPIVDGNVIRVLSRIFAISADPKSSAGQKIFWQKAEEILPNERGSDYGSFNQALMELGATVCSPENPACLICPVGGECRARKEANPEDFPKPKKKTEYRDVRMSAAVVRHGERILFLRRPDVGILKGMWELPMVEGDLAVLQKIWSVVVVRPLPAVRHSVLNRRLKIAPFLCSPSKDLGMPDAKSPERRWLTLSEAEDLPTSSMNRKILKHLA